MDAKSPSFISDRGRAILASEVGVTSPKSDLDLLGDSVYKLFNCTRHELLMATTFSKFWLVSVAIGAVPRIFIGWLCNVKSCKWNKHWWIKANHSSYWTKIIIDNIRKNVNHWLTLVFNAPCWTIWYWVWTSLPSPCLVRRKGCSIKTWFLNQIKQIIYSWESITKIKIIDRLNEFQTMVD